MLQRFYNNIEKWFLPNRILIIYGPRRVGKTTLLKNYLSSCKYKYRLDSGDNLKIRTILNSSDFDQIKQYVEGYELIVIDEAQQIKGIGQALKILSDEFPQVKIVVTGSSSFKISQNDGEPLTGRKRELLLFPLSHLELSLLNTKYELNEKLEEYLLYGSYPEVLSLNTRDEKLFVIRELSDSYLLKDILSYEQLRNPSLLLNILKALAFQVGHLVSMNELSNTLGINIRTVERYLNLLEKSYVIFKLTGFSRNLRKEINSKAKYYFYDNGIRNAIINQFNALNDRNDIGQLWENFLISERVKYNAYQGLFKNMYFWRTYSGSEIDLIEEWDGNIAAYEFKYSKGKKNMPKDFSENYKVTNYSVINKDNYLDFIV